MSKKLKRYIADQPQIPSGFRYKVPILVSDSKGFTLRNACQDYEFPLESWCKSGARTADLVDLIEERIEKAIKRHNHIIIYLWAGTCDLTKKTHGYIKLRHQGNKTIDKIVKEYKRAIKIIDRYPDAEIKLVDCPILSIRNYNKSKGHPKPETFKVEDFIVTRQIQSLNAKIDQLSQGNYSTTVKVGRHYFRNRKIKRGKYRKSINITYNKKDGVHPGTLLSLVITKQLLIDTYRECYHITQQAEFIQLQVEEAEMESIL